MLNGGTSSTATVGLYELSMISDLESISSDFLADRDEVVPPSSRRTEASALRLRVGVADCKYAGHVLGPK